MNKSVGIFMILFLSGVSAFASDKSQAINGNAVAIDSSCIIFNGFVYVEILIEISNEGKNLSKFVWIRGSIGSLEWNQWLAGLPSIHQFRIKRDKIKKKMIKNDPDLLILPRHEKAKLPFGVKAKFYESMDWPTKPAI
jgi:hypothetical protein